MGWEEETASPMLLMCKISTALNRGGGLYTNTFACKLVKGAHANKGRPMIICARLFRSVSPAFRQIEKWAGGRGQTSWNFPNKLYTIRTHKKSGTFFFIRRIRVYMIHSKNSTPINVGRGGIRALIREVRTSAMFLRIVWRRSCSEGRG